MHENIDTIFTLNFPDYQSKQKVSFRLGKNRLCPETRGLKTLWSRIIIFHRNTHDSLRDNRLAFITRGVYFICHISIYYPFDRQKQHRIRVLRAHHKPQLERSQLKFLETQETHASLQAAALLRKVISK